MVLLGGSAVLSAIVDNIPYVATMSPVVAELVAERPGNGEALWWSLALGADLGGNATAIGASANVVMLGAGGAGRTQDRVLGVHEVRPGRRLRHRRPHGALHRSALPLRRRSGARQLESLFL